MHNWYSKCGCNCGRCPLYVRNLQTDEDRQRTAEGMKYIGWNPTPEKLRQCAGCQVIEGFHYIKNCRVRVCAMKSDMKNCAYCSEFPCAEVPTVSIANPEEFRAQREEQLGQPISDKDYTAYIEVYAGLNNLKRIRESISSDELVEVKRFPYSPKIIPYPTDQGLSKAKNDSYKRLHEILSKIRVSSMGLDNTDLFAVQYRLKKRAEQVFRFLWMVGKHGALKSKPSPHIVIDSATYYDNKKGSIPGSEAEFEIVFNALREHGFESTIIPLMEDQWKTEKGHLRQRELGGTRPVWQVELAGDKTVLKALKEYTDQIQDKLGSKVYSGFSKIDMHCFG